MKPSALPMCPQSEPKTSRTIEGSERGKGAHPAPHQRVEQRRGQQTRNEMDDPKGRNPVPNVASRTLKARVVVKRRFPFWGSNRPRRSKLGLPRKNLIWSTL